MTTIEIHPLGYLNDYCDAMCYKWAYIDGNQHSETKMRIVIDQEMSAADLVMLGVDFMRWKEDYLNK